MALNLPPDPYKALGVSKDAKLPEIRSAHRKLVLKCHPDKVQDADLKAIKQDEFQQVQQAYELLSDDTRRLQYDEQVKLFALRREMGRGIPTPRSNPFEYEVRTAEPRPTTFSRPQPAPAPQPKVYAQQPPPRSYEDVVFEEPMRTAKKSASYESADRRRPSTRDGARESERRKNEEDEISRQRWEKEMKRATHGERKKSRDKEKRRGTEEKHSRSQPYVEDDSDDYRAPPPPREKKSNRHRMEEEIRMRNEAAKDALRQAPMTPKWDGHKEYAAEYMQAARRKAAPAEEFAPGPMRRAETFSAPEAQKYNIRYAAPQSPHSPHSPHLSPSDDEAPKRSSARTTRRSSETPPSRSSRETKKETKKEHKRSPSTRAREAYIVEPPSPTPPVVKTPKLQSHSSAPPTIPGFLREKPIRSKTQDYLRHEHAIPLLPRSKTFQTGDRDHGRDKDRGGSRLKKSVNYNSDESEPDSPLYASPRHSHSPPPRRRAAPEPTQTKYIIDNGRSVPISSRHRSEMRNIDDEDYHTRDRSESPRGGRHNERPPLSRNTGNSGSRQAPQRSHSQAYYPPDPPEPVILTARPKMPARESGQHRSGSGRGGPYFGEVNFAPKYGPEHVIYSAVPGPDAYRRGSDPSHHRDTFAYPAQRGGRTDPIYT